MTSVARAVKAPVTSVHWHFRTRDDLLDALATRMAHRFYDEAGPITVGRPWDETLRETMHGLREQLLGMGSFLELSFYRVGALFADPATRQRMVDRLEAELAVLVGAGLPVDDAYRLHTAANEYVRGFVLVELAHGRSQRPITADDRRLLDADAYPLLSQLPYLTTPPGPASDEQFALGLELVIDGIRARIPARRITRPRPARVR
jgi:AcrR family transcriptional regulator